MSCIKDYWYTMKKGSPNGTKQPLKNLSIVECLAQSNF